MRTLYCLCILVSLMLALSGCNKTKPANSESNINPTTETIKSMAWLVGKWVRTNDEEGNTTKEEWALLSNNTLQGKGYTITATKDTSFNETMIIQCTTPQLCAMTVLIQNQPDTRFSLTPGKKAFTCYNHNNPFPKKIEYKKTKKGMKAVISEGGPTIPFLFEKASQ